LIWLFNEKEISVGRILWILWHSVQKDTEIYGIVIERLLRQYDGLKSYFLLLFTHINLLIQMDAPTIHIIQGTLFSTIGKTLGKFIKPELLEVLNEQMVLFEFLNSNITLVLYWYFHLFQTAYYSWKFVYYELLF